MSAWLELMLEEIRRKRSEQDAAEAEQARRRTDNDDTDPAHGTPPADDQSK